MANESDITIEAYQGGVTFHTDLASPSAQVAYVEARDPNSAPGPYQNATFDTVVARVHPIGAEQGADPALTVSGNITPDGDFTGRIAVMGPAIPPNASYTEIFFENGCPVAAYDADRNYMRPQTSVDSAEAMARYEATAAQLAAMPEVQAVVNNLRDSMDIHGVSPDAAGVDLASGRRLPDCSALMF